MSKNNHRRPRRTQERTPPNKIDHEQPLYTFQQLMEDYGGDSDLSLLTGKEQDPVNGRTSPDVAGRPDSGLDLADDGDKGRSHDAADPWPTPGDLTMLPNASSLHTLATIDIHLDLTESMLDWAEAAVSDLDSAGALASLTCVSDNLFNLDDMFSNLGNSGGERQGAASLLELLDRFNSAQDRYSALFATFGDHGMMEEMRSPLTGIHERDLQYMEQAIGPTQIRLHLRALTTALLKCQNMISESRGDPNRSESRFAWQYLACDLYHNAVFWDCSFESLTPESKRSVEKEYRVDLNTCRAVYESILDDFNAGLTTRLSPILKQMPDPLPKDFSNIKIDPFGCFANMAVGPCLKDCGEEHSTPYPYVAFHHRGARWIKTWNEPYPKGFPAGAALQHLNYSEHVYEYFEEDARTVIDDMLSIARIFVERGLHDLQPKDVRKLVRMARRSGMTEGAIWDMFDAATLYDPEATSELLALGGVNEPPVSYEQAQSIVETARSVGIDDNVIHSMMESMWRILDAPSLDVEPQHLPRRDRRNVGKAARWAGIPDAVIADMLDEI